MRIDDFAHFFGRPAHGERHGRTRLEEFDALDLDAIKQASGASFVIPNGRRYWVLDRIESYRVTPRRELGGHEFLVPAVVELSLWDLLSRKPYRPTTVARDTIYTYLAGTKVYRLIDPDGKVYTMQSATRAIDTSSSFVATIESRPAPKPVWVVGWICWSVARTSGPAPSVARSPRAWLQLCG